MTTDPHVTSGCTPKIVETGVGNPRSHWFRAVCKAHQWMGKAHRNSREKAAEDMASHVENTLQYDFGHGKMDRDLETALRLIATSGYTFEEVRQALSTPWPHNLPRREPSWRGLECVFDIRGLGQGRIEKLKKYLGVKDE